MVNKLDGNFGYVKSFRSFAPVMIIPPTAERIKQKAHELFMQYGLRSVSMDDIANQLGMSKKTIYQYYADKDELVDAVLTDEFSKNELRCESDRKNAKNAVHEIFLAMDMVAEMLSNMNPSLIFDMQKYYPQVFTKFLAHKNNYLYNVIKENLEKGIQEELFRPEINIEIISRYRLESMLLPFNPDFFQKIKYNLADIEEEILLHYLYGIASPKGYKLITKYQLDRFNNEKK